MYIFLQSNYEMSSQFNQFKQPTNYLSVFDHFVGLMLKGLTFLINTFISPHFSLSITLKRSDSLWLSGVFKGV